MDSMFTIPYSEYAVIVQLAEYLKKKDGYSIFLPASRQEKNVDFIERNSKTGKSVTFQVKDSRSWSDNDVNGTFYAFWFNNFIDKVKTEPADYYILFGNYSLYSRSAKVSSKHAHWRSMFLCFSSTEMYSLLKEVKTKKEKKTGRFFSIYTYGDNEYYGHQNLVNNPNFTEHLLDNKISSIRKALSQ